MNGPGTPTPSLPKGTSASASGCCAVMRAAKAWGCMVAGAPIRPVTANACAANSGARNRPRSGAKNSARNGSEKARYRISMGVLPKISPSSSNPAGGAAARSGNGPDPGLPAAPKQTTKSRTRKNATRGAAAPA